MSKQKDEAIYRKGWDDGFAKGAAAARFQLKDENAELRELVRIMHGELVACEENGYVCGGHKFDERVRELGVEV